MHAAIACPECGRLVYVEKGCNYPCERCGVLWRWYRRPDPPTRNLTDREKRARVVHCPRCGRSAGEPCVSGDLDLLRAHNERMETYGAYVREQYCANEMLSGHPCGTPGCASCGGMNAAELEAFNFAIDASRESRPAADGPLQSPTA